MRREEAKRPASRLKEIRKMGKSTLSIQQKKEFRNAVVVIKERLNEAGSGFVLSLSTAAVIIIMLLIILV